MQRKTGFKVLVICLALLFVNACSSWSQKEPITEAIGTVIGDPTATGEKMFFPVFVEELEVIARLDSTSVHELIQKGDRVKISLIDLNYAKRINSTPIAHLITRIEIKEKPHKK